jgi:chromosome segregation ATPase
MKRTLILICICLAYKNVLLAQTLNDTTILINAHQVTLKKAQDKMNKLLREQGELSRKLGRYKSDLEENKADQSKAASDLQSSINADDDSKSKNQKKVKNLIEEQDRLEKKIRNTQKDLDDNKADQEKQQALVNSEQSHIQSLKAVKPST